ncbi:MAG: hypothetical protein AAFZ15_06045 [Bacteroidota bacterium]
MYRLSSIIAFLGLAFGLIAQSPHGEDFKMNCAACHTSDSWEIPMDAWENGNLVNPRYFDEPQKEQTNGQTRFNHSETNFPLEGGHTATDCRLCHNALVFDEANTECISCHIDLHNMTVGSDCARCHTVDNWLVDDVNQLHVENGFPLLGSHAIISCDECHISETGLQFNRIGNECVNCHMEDYMAATEPNHVQLGYSLACMDCHDINAFSWDANILHDFFPLVKGHDISDCNACHDNPDFTGVPTECIACHQTDYDAALNPDHKALNFGTDCASCHTLDLDWMPAQYRQHDIDYFPIYSGEHKGEWSDCIECHPSPGNYAIFTCTTCHGKSETDSEHRNVGAYVYESGACLACHPDGNEEGSFNHNDTNFPLTGAHVSVDCNSCHTNGYAGTPTDCAACHLTDFQQTTNPDHQQLGFSTDCASCHTTDPNWTPATFDHDAMYFPIYSGNHKNEWNDCVDCHTVAGNYAIFSCIDCHEHNDPADLLDEHDEVNGYEYNSIKCLECHPNGD